MRRIRNWIGSFGLLDLIVWAVSMLAILLSFFLLGNDDYLQLSASLLGACSLILIAKGNVLGQFLSVVFSVMYGIISYFTRYYGEMLTYLGMTAPVAIVAIVSWLRHPFRGNHSEVTVNRLALWEYPLLLLISAAVAAGFYFLLDFLETPNLWWSTVSILTSCLAMLLSIRRSPLYALGYCLNDVVLIVLWSLAARTNLEYVAMVVCFAVFLLNDVYGLVNWLRLRKRQAEIEANDPL